jgi:hypothetical protein
MGFLQFISEVSKSIKGAACFIVMFIGILGILSITTLIIYYIKIRALAIILSTFAGCILMIPITWAFNSFVDSRVGKKETIMANQETIVKQSIRIEELERTIDNLEHTMFNIQEFEKILDLGLIETKLRQTTVKKENLDTKYNSLPLIGGSSAIIEYLEVMNHDIIAKFGVDLKTIKLTNKEDSRDTVIVSGITSKFMGTMQNDPDWVVSEIRKINRNKDGQETKVEIMTSGDYKNILIEQMKESQKDYQRRLSQGLETKFMDETVNKLAENFIKIFLLPLNKTIEFQSNPQSDGLALLDYIKKEIENKNIELTTIKNKLE